MPVITRNMKKKMQTINQTYSVNIDFDDASESWKENKISIGNGMYKYKTNSIYTQCIMILKDGTDCNLRRKKGSSFCRKHN
mgnify:FL=1|tara:strand:- start:590 stop:832 length:243 start_codon:yes stop_codon:yes gene_type:complete